MTAKIEIIGPQKVNGAVRISGAKNAALPLLAAGLLSENGLNLHNIPSLVDVQTMLSLLERLGLSYEINDSDAISQEITLQTSSIDNFIAPYEIVKKMRASILILGPLLSRFGKCKVSLPGGCAIGVRPIDLHLKGLEKLGATIELENGYVNATAPHGLKGAEIDFPIVTVTGTENLIMASVLANGTTVLKNVAKEPEITDLCECLIKMGANISGYGTDTIVIKGVSELHYAEHSVIADRIEAGTYAIAAGITKGKIDLIGKNIRNLLPSFIERMEQTGLIFSDILKDSNKIKKNKNEKQEIIGLHVESSGTILPVNIETAPYPGFPTDLQAQAMALLCLAEGESNIRENIWENRFMHVAELLRMGANICIQGATAKIIGVPNLEGAQVMATDLRASFSLILAGLVAKGKTVVDRIYHLERGYSCVKEKLAGCNIKIDRIPSELRRN